MNEEIYELIERELALNRIREDVDDVLLDLAEAVAEHGVGGTRTVSVKYGKTVIQAVGRCEAAEDGVEEEEEEFDVWVEEIVIGKTHIEIKDYIM